MSDRGQSSFCLARSEEIRKQFPMLSLEEDGRTLVYFNNAATALKPQSVIDAMTEYYTTYGENIARGVDAVG